MSNAEISSKMTSKDESILQRLDQIANVYERRDNLYKKLRLYSESDATKRGPKNIEVSALINLIKKTEQKILCEYGHLRNNLALYYLALGLNNKELSMIDAFRPNQIAVSYEKHYSGQKTNDIDDKRYSLIYRTELGSAFAPDPQIDNYIWFCVYKGKIYSAGNLILDLMLFWDVFVRNHTEIDINKFIEKINDIRNNNANHNCFVPTSIVKSLEQSQGQIAAKTKTLNYIEKDILNRLDNISLHYEERDTLNIDLTKFTSADIAANAARKNDLDRTLKRIKNEEIYTLYELVHLKDNVDKYFATINISADEINVIDAFRPFRVAANFVNTHKHGVRGKNAKTALIDYTLFIFAKKGETQSPDDPIAGVIPVINFDGDLHFSKDCINDLISVWILLLVNHTDIDVEPFNKNIRAIKSRKKATSTYTMPIHEGWIKDAKLMSIERKQLNI
jgi:hypothetical protein